MSDFIIIANNTSDLPETLLRDLDITILPLGFNIGETRYTQMPNKEFYQKIREGAMPTTNAASIGEYTDLYEAALQEGRDVLNLVFSSGLSATYSSAVMAAEEMREKYPDRKIFVVDTVSAALGEGMLIRTAAEMRNAGKSIEEVRDWVEDTKLKIQHWFTINDLGHLKRGGRISAAQAVIGGMLGVKPMLRVNDAGQLEPIGKVRGRAAAIEKLVSLVAENGGNFLNETAYISHSDCEEDALILEKQVKEKFGVENVVISCVGPVIGSHTGVGVLALYGLSDKR